MGNVVQCASDTLLRQKTVATAVQRRLCRSTRYLDPHGYGEITWPAGSRDSYAKLQTTMPHHIHSHGRQSTGWEGGCTATFTGIASAIRITVPGQRRALCTLSLRSSWARIENQRSASVLQAAVLVYPLTHGTVFTEMLHDCKRW